MADILLNIDKLSLNLGGQEILHDLSWEIQDFQRVGLVGANGAGKSTLMKLMAQELEADSGTIFRASGLTWGRLEQEPRLDTSRTIFEETLTASAEIERLRHALQLLEEQMGDPAVYTAAEALADVMARHAALTDQFTAAGGERYASRAREVLTRLGLGERRWQDPVRHLSGGEKKLVLLAKLLLKAPRLLLLDEPDNHLDVPAKRLLEQVISSYQGCVIIISHDRYLLDEVVTHIAELDGGQMTSYPGTYSNYVTQRELARLRQQQLYVAQQKEIARIEAAIARFEKWAHLVVDERHIRQARHRRKMLDRMERVEKVTSGRRMGLEIDGWRGSNKVIDLREVGLQLPNGRWLWRKLNHTIWHGERVGLVGANGVGKSMLLKQLLQPEAVPQGEIRIGPSCRIGYYSQEQEFLNFDNTLLAEIRAEVPLSEANGVSFLTRFLYSYDQIRGKIRELSGGERSRLQLAKLMLQQPNLLILDEPTNNLDIQSIEVLEEVLDEFEGTVLVISHDRYFLDKVVDRVIELYAEALHTYDGGYTDYVDARGLQV